MQLNLEETYRLHTHYRAPKVFVVIGMGGTGGYLIRDLARQIAITNRLRKLENLREHKLIIIDQDTVSLSNLNRQNFIEKDLDKNKAEVLAIRYGQAYGLNIQYLDQYITDSNMLSTIVKEQCEDPYNSIPVLIDCVDNNKTRVFINESYNELSKWITHGIFSLSSGNEFLNGQVVCGFLPGLGFDKYYRDLGVFKTPSVVDMFPEILEGGDKLPTELSCDEAAVSHPQNIMTNITAANHLFNFANTLMTAKTDNPELKGLSIFAVTYDTEQGTYRTFPNKKSVMSQYIASE